MKVMCSKHLIRDEEQGIVIKFMTYPWVGFRYGAHSSSKLSSSTQLSYIVTNA